MTLEEKAGLCSGADFWQTKAVDRLGIGPVMMADGPHGLRKENAGEPGVAQTTEPATCFPSAAGLACSWDRQLVRRMGRALGQESRSHGVSILLGPAVNIKRSPLCGRNFEYFSEDPWLASELATEYIQGVQSQGVGTSLKHFAANNQEYRRMSVNAIIGERALREIYLKAFEQAVKKGQPWSVMCSYNQVNGDFASENSWLLTKVLREEWNFQGFVVSDWGAVNERDRGLAAGLDLEMPSSGGIGDQKIIRAVRNGTLPIDVLDASVARILAAVLRAPSASLPVQEDHHALARHIAAESMVLLKNTAGILPLDSGARIAVVGQFAHEPRYQGGGSSHVHPTQVDDIYDAIRQAAGPLASTSFAPGYRMDSDEPDVELIREAQRSVQHADVVLVFAGLPESYESEGYDRDHLCLPHSHNAVIEALCDVHQHVVVILSNGAPVTMPWIERVDALIECYLGGQALGGAIADVIFGQVNPCGKLAETFPKQLSDNPAYLNFPGEGDTVNYAEGIFVGYRYYEKKKMAPLFPFGFGLSYTTFAYVSMECSAATVREDETVEVTVRVKNVGTRAGKEIVELYVSGDTPGVIRPEKELKGFEKISLEAGEEGAVTFRLDLQAFAHYDVGVGDWRAEPGIYTIMVGGSSADIALTKKVTVVPPALPPTPYTRNSTIGDLLADDRDEAQTVASEIRQELGWGNGEEDNRSLTLVQFFPLRALVSFSQGRCSEDQVAHWLQRLNGH